MSIDVSDLRPTIVPKSDQLNSEQLLGGPITVRVTDVRIGSSDEQPISVHYEGENGRPFKPCKTMRKVLILGWGPDGRDWVGKSMTLYNDPQVKFGGAEVGGIRISHMSDLPSSIRVSLTATKGKKAIHEIGLLKIDNGPALPDVLKAITSAHNKATMEAAKELAGRLLNPADVTVAQGAYRTRVTELKAAASKKTSAKTLQSWITDVEGATSSEAAALVLDEARDALDDVLDDLARVEPGGRLGALLSEAVGAVDSEAPVCMPLARRTVIAGQIYELERGPALRNT